LFELFVCCCKIALIGDIDDGCAGGGVGFNDPIGLILDA
jgi:hypothetical protein